jgi:pimeloyl-ACP methyl ester carboxylesterase
MRVSVGGAQLFFEVSGHEWALAGDVMERRPVLVGLHGGPGLDGTKLRHQLAPLADVAQVVVPDQRGHGRSDRGAPESWNLATWATDVKGLCDALGIEHPVVLGNSFGGFVAQEYAATYPDHPAGLVLTSTCPRLPGPAETAARLRQVGGEEAEDVFWQNWKSPSEEALKDWRRVVGPLMSARIDADPVLAKLRDARIETLDVNVSFEAESRAMDLRGRLATVRCRTLVAAGEHDPLIPVSLAQEIVDAIPGDLARLEVVENASHDVLDDNPTEAYRILREFLLELVP